MEKDATPAPVEQKDQDLKLAITNLESIPRLRDDGASFTIGFVLSLLYKIQARSSAPSTLPGEQGGIMALWRREAEMHGTYSPHREERFRFGLEQLVGLAPHTPEGPTIEQAKEVMKRAQEQAVLDAHRIMTLPSHRDAGRSKIIEGFISGARWACDRLTALYAEGRPCKELSEEEIQRIADAEMEGTVVVNATPSIAYYDGFKSGLRFKLDRTTREG